MVYKHKVNIWTSHSSTIMKYLVVLCLAVATGLPRIPKLASKIDPSFNWRVVGGSDAPEGLYPYQVSLKYFGSHLCGGSIVKPEWIITAAHCVAGEHPEDYRVVAGSNKLSSGGEKYAVLEIHYNEAYDPWYIQNDVAILKVEPIRFSDNIQPILLETRDLGGDVNVTLSGWGTRRLGGLLSDNLQHLDLKTTTFEQCKRLHTTPVIDSEICTFTKRGEGACHGDSGGPLVSRDDDGNRRLCGIVSWGQPCAEGYPDVFSKVSSFLDWFEAACSCSLKD